MAGSAFSIYPLLYKIYNGRRVHTQEFRNIFHCNRMAEMVYYGKFFLSERSVPIWTTQEKKSR